MVLRRLLQAKTRGNKLQYDEFQEMRIPLSLHSMMYALLFQIPFFPVQKSYSNFDSFCILMIINLVKI